MLAEIVFYTLISGTLLIAFYKWATLNNEYFVKRNLKHKKPRFLIGDTIGLLLKLYTPAEFVESLYYRFPKEKLIGFFNLREPVYLARDVDLIRQLGIKDFDNFEDRIAFVDDKSDTLFGKSLFLLAGNKWRDVRATLSPAFTGSKMRNMFELVVECADDVAKYMIEDAKQGKPNQWEMKELYSRFTSDVIASCAFGLKADSLRDRTNEFFIIGRQGIDFSSKKAGFRLLLIRMFPTLMRILNIEFFSAKVKQFFKSMVLDTMKEREKKNIFRPDTINILMQVRSGNLKHQHEETDKDDAGFATVEESHIGKAHVKREWTDDEIVAQYFLFFVAGFDTSSSLMSFMSYELAVNQNIQQKVYEEIREVNAGLNGARLSYDTLSKLKYLDQVISEALRKWPPAIIITRKCTKSGEYDLAGKRIFIERGTAIWIPIYPIHHDAELYENHEQFDPERFSDENKHKIKPGSFIPFGIGPRNFIGSRFALMEIKALFFYLLLNFNIQPYGKTQIPLKLAKSVLSWSFENGINLEFKPRA